MFALTNSMMGGWAGIYLQVSFTELPSGTITSDEVSSAIKSGGITTSR